MESWKSFEQIDILLGNKFGFFLQFFFNNTMWDVGLKQHKDIFILFDQFLKLNFVFLETLLVNT